MNLNLTLNNHCQVADNGTIKGTFIVWEQQENVQY